MTPDQLEALHRLCFDIAPRPWSAEEFSDYLASRYVHLCFVENAFSVVRVAGYESELLTIATHPDFRRQGLAHQVLDRAQHWAKIAGATEMFLEVAEDNEAAQALYLANGYAQTGARKDYYQRSGKEKISALIMRRPL